MDTVRELLEKLGIPFAYDHFAEGEGPEPPFICFRSPESDNFSADGIAYLKTDLVDVELYTDRKDPETERSLEELLDAAGIFYDRDEVWIESERLFETVYEFAVPAGDLSADGNDG